MESFPQDREALLKGLTLPPRSELLSLTPFVDKAGLLRVGGRLCKAPLPDETRHPIILDARHDVSRLVVMFHYLKSRCAGDAQVLKT